MSARFAVGIDLGTTNSVVAYAPLDQETPEIHLVPIPQVVGPGQVEELPFLPSFLYLPTSDETASGSLFLAGQPYGQAVVGTYARQISAEQPDRTVAAAKSWLCHHRVDRQAPILPWNAPTDVGKISPVSASKIFLMHLIDAWHRHMPETPIDQQIVVLTVPASFDMSARELTREAALAAGLPENFILLEEPQAAVYHWLHVTGDRWRKLVSKGDELLVCDVGGGTTDLTLVRVDEEQGELVLRRIAVGNHLLVGGDNMDLALAHFAAGKLASSGVKLNPWQSVSLWHSCRKAKESLLAPVAIDPQTISVLGRGSRLIGGTVTTEIRRSEAESVLIDGFFPFCSKSDRPLRQPTSGFQELGLPFESDTGITKHVAAFLSEQIDSSPGSPTHLLFNGGVFKSIGFRDRMQQVIESWRGDAGGSIKVLGGPEDLDRAVAWGAAYYAWAKQRGGIRIRGGTARSYYVGIETSGLSIPGMPRPLQAVCVVPFGMEEGTDADIPGREVGLIVGQPARFRFFASAIRQNDQLGECLRGWDEEELVETSPMELTLASDQALDEGFVPVRFHSKITELGMLELWCHSTRDHQRWKLEFNVREEGTA